MQKYGIQEIIGLLPLLLYIAVVLFTIGLIIFLWHLNQEITIVLSLLCFFVLAFHVGTTITPWITTRSPFQTPQSNLTGNLWRGMRRQRHPSGLTEYEERLDVGGHGDELDTNTFKWLMEREDVYWEALRAEREYLRQRGLLKFTSVQNQIV
jgi:hypothetical protein